MATARGDELYVRKPGLVATTIHVHSPSCRSPLTEEEKNYVVQSLSHMAEEYDLANEPVSELGRVLEMAVEERLGSLLRISPSSDNFVAKKGLKRRLQTRIYLKAVDIRIAKGVGVFRDDPELAIQELMMELRPCDSSMLRLGYCSYYRIGGHLTYGQVGTATYAMLLGVVHQNRSICQSICRVVPRIPVVDDDVVLPAEAAPAEPAPPPLPEATTELPLAPRGLKRPPSPREVSDDKRHRSHSPRSPPPAPEESTTDEGFVDESDHAGEGEDDEPEEGEMIEIGSDEEVTTSAPV
jgi:hypothetical protein